MMNLSPKLVNIPINDVMIANVLGRGPFNFKHVKKTPERVSRKAKIEEPIVSLINYPDLCIPAGKAEGLS